ncbi:MAG: Hpt domain-containing protein [Gammaproteobacteria bacterium]
MTLETIIEPAEELDPAVRALLPNYIRRRESDMELIASLVRRGEYKEISTLAHNIRGSGAAYGYPRLSELGALIENAVETNDVDSLKVLTAELDAYIKQMRP